MDYSENERDRQLMKEFLTDLLFQAKGTNEFNLLVDLLLKMQAVLIKPRRSYAATYIPPPDSQFEIFRRYPDGSVLVGTIRGIENAERILASLNSKENMTYLLYDRNARKVVEPQRRSKDADEPTHFR